MEAGRARRHRDDSSRLPTLSLGLSSVRLIVTKLESEHTRVTVTASKTFESDEIVKYESKVDKTNNDFLLGRPSGQVWNRLLINFGLALYKCVPSVTFGNFGTLVVTTALCAPKMISYFVLYPFCRLVFGTLYPAYASYKAVRTKNLKEYVSIFNYYLSYHMLVIYFCTARAIVNIISINDTIKISTSLSNNDYLLRRGGTQFAPNIPVKYGMTLSRLHNRFETVTLPLCPSSYS